MPKEPKPRSALASAPVGIIKAFRNTAPWSRKKRPPTYAEIQAEVFRADGFMPATCWIADVKRRMGYPVRAAPNRNSDEVVKPCPPQKAEPIRRAIERLQR